MLTRACAGGVVFYDTRVFILKNDKGEWVLPKGVIRDKQLALDVALQRVKHEGNIDASIISPAGETSYEFYSYSRKRPVCNKIDWFIMEARNDSYAVNKQEGFLDGGFFPIDEALEKITYSQDKSLVRLAYRKYNHFCNHKMAEVVG
ncbi:MAG TPA: NUDIX hydrolase [Peptococcaceae bacterium]|jgi:predicted NUDIX family NTP pyrophosphohydrolase|nr:NUDIX hydrolase [Clostridia bacterium]HOB82708.1 NUDIX hydrolase [Peptococcaceae bacterium]HPZ71894.1 NUDIX hydrolase [Peptococcaceae bacterium]HQD54801.1 NUDIX hydrolase [Peptococcaceae bacterium]